MKVNLRRMYVDCRYGQLHLWAGFPSGGGFGERTTLVCLHDAGGSGVDFHMLLAGIGDDRSVYAPDAPGTGQSDAPPHRPAMGDYAAAVADLLDQLRLREVDLLGCGSGADAALHLASSGAAQVRRLVIAGRASPAVQPRQPLLDVDPAPVGAAASSGLIRKVRGFLDRD